MQQILVDVDRWRCGDGQPAVNSAMAGAKQGNSSRLSQSSELRRSNRSIVSRRPCPNLGMGPVRSSAVLFPLQTGPGHKH